MDIRMDSLSSTLQKGELHMIPSTRFCDNCGAANRPQGKYCANCGMPLQSISYSPQQASAGNVVGPSLTGRLGSHSLLRQRYRIIKQLGQGGMAAVYKAEDMRFGNAQRAIKEMSQSSLNTQQDLQEAIQAFEREAMLLAGLMHQNLPRIYDHFSDSGRWYLVMDYIEGDTLESLLGQALNGTFSVEDLLPIGLQLCTVLDYLHTRQPPIIFRDLKPENIMLTWDGHLYLIDFGIARLFKSGQRKDTIALGSPGYAAPEQYGKAQTQTTPGTDIYCLGVTFHQMLSGNDPSLNPFHFAPLDLDASYANLEQLIMRMMETDKDKRPSIQEIKQVLQYTATQQQSLHSIGIAGRQRPPSSNQYASAGTLIYTYQEHEEEVHGVAWSPDGTYIVSGSWDDTVRVWEATTGREVFTYRGHDDDVNAVAWSPNGRYIASGSDDNTVRVRDAFTGRKMCEYEGHSDYVRALAWSPDGTRIASASDDETVQIWDIRTGHTLLSYDGHEDDLFTEENCVQAVAWSPDGKYIASADDDETVRVWEAATGDELFSYEKHDDDVNAVAWSPDGRSIASASDDGTVRVRYADTGKKVYTYHNHTDCVNALAWSPDGRYIASASSDGTVRIWVATTGQDVFTYRGHASDVQAVAWSPNGRLIASGDDDGTVQVWQAV